MNSVIAKQIDLNSLLTNITDVTNGYYDGLDGYETIDVPWLCQIYRSAYYIDDGEQGLMKYIVVTERIEPFTLKWYIFDGAGYDAQSYGNVKQIPSSLALMAYGHWTRNRYLYDIKMTGFDDKNFAEEIETVFKSLSIVIHQHYQNY